MTLRFFSFCAATLLAASIPASAQAAPQQLLNKTLTVNMTVTIPGKGSDGSTANMPRSIQRLIYISSAGRVFSRATRTVGRNQKQTERGPEQTAGDATGSLKFVGNRLVGLLQFKSGATMMNVDFDPSFQSCTVNVVVGRDSGKPIVWKGLNGVTYTSTGAPQVGGLSCSIQSGNALAG